MFVREAAVLLWNNLPGEQANFLIKSRAPERW